jgi:hypothetical protein
VWYGGVLLAIGGLITMWPGEPPGTAPRRSQAGYAATLDRSVAEKQLI